MQTFGNATSGTSGDSITTTHTGAYYDPYDFEIDKDPYPIWKRLRDERPLYYNEKYDFFALSRFEDVEGCSKDWRRYSSAKGTLLELIKRGVKIPPGSIIFEDPPEHDVHRALLTDVFKPRRIAALEPKVREFCARSLQPLVAKGGFDFVADLGAPVPMRTIGMLLGIPDQDQQAIRDRIDDTLKLKEGAPTDDMLAKMAKNHSEVFAAYIDWRASHPSDDIMTELLTAEFDDIDGKRRRLTRAEVLGYVNLLAAAGNETTTRLIGWAGKVLAEHPDQRRELAKDPRLIPGAVEELLRYESPSPVQARYVTQDVEHHGQPVKAGSVMLLLTASANRDERRFPDGDRFDVHRPIERHVAFGYGVHFCLGAALARLEARIALEEVLKRFPDWEVDWEHARQAHTSTVRGWERLPVITR
jgi:cytochrome P450